MLTLTPTQVRRLAITRQRLAGPFPTANSAAIMDILRDIRCLQLDPIRAVERTQYLVLWSRLGQYERDDLDKLLWSERQLFEYWAHAASIVLTEDYAIHQVQMRQVAQGETAAWQRLRQWAMENEPFQRYILQQLHEHGPLALNQLEDSSMMGWESGGWTSGRNVNRMVDFLWTSGQVMVAERRGLHKKWALSEHCFPEWTHHEPLPEAEAVRQAVEISLRALGVGTLKQIKAHFTRDRYPNLNKVVTELIQIGRIMEVAIQADSGITYPGQWYLYTADLPLLEQLQQGHWQPRTVLLSPFDNLICDRSRTELLWDFYFRIEIYVPLAKRQYGYYVLPILHGDQLIGRIDPRMERKTGKLFINAVYAEASAPQDNVTGQAVAQAIESLATFLGAREIVYSDAVPTGWRHILR